MTINGLIQLTVTAGLVIGAADLLLGRWRPAGWPDLGREFKRGLAVMPDLTLAMAGMIILAPPLGSLAVDATRSWWECLSVDPSASAALIAIDMGGYHLAKSVALSESSGLFFGVIASSLLGGTLVFSIPIGLGLINDQDREPFLLGIIAGLITLPAGAYVGGLAAAFPARELAINCLPLAAVSVLLSLCVYFIPDRTILAARLFGSAVRFTAVVGLVLGGIQEFTSTTLLSGSPGLGAVFLIIGRIGLFLAGMFPLVNIALRVFHRPLAGIGSRLGINAVAASAIPLSTVNCIPTFEMLSEMDLRGKLFNSAFVVSGASLFGAQLAMAAAVESRMVYPFVAAKAAGALLSLPCVLLLARVYLRGKAA